MSESSWALTVTYITFSVGIITSVPAQNVGVASAIFSAAQQVGGAINIAVITTIFVEVRKHNPLPSYTSTASALWYLVALGVAQAVAVAIFFKPTAHLPSPARSRDSADEKDDAAADFNES